MLEPVVLDADVPVPVVDAEDPLAVLVVDEAVVVEALVDVAVPVLDVVPGSGHAKHFSGWLHVIDEPVLVPPAPPVPPLLHAPLATRVPSGA